MNTQTELALSPTAPQRDKHGRWSTCLPGIVLQIDERTRHEVPFAGPPDVDPGAGGCASEHRLAGHQAPPLGDWKAVAPC